MAIYFYKKFYDINWEDVKDQVDGDPDSNEFLIYNLENGWDINSLHNGQSQLHEAAFHMDDEKAKLLFHYGIDNKATYDGDTVMDIFIDRYMQPNNNGSGGSLQSVLKDSIKDGYEKAQVTYYCYLYEKDVVKDHPEKYACMDFQELVKEVNPSDYPTKELVVDYDNLDSVKETVNKITKFIKNDLSNNIKTLDKKSLFNFLIRDKNNHRKYEFLMDAIDLGAKDEVLNLCKALLDKNLVFYDRPYNIFGLTAFIRLATVDKTGIELLNRFFDSLKDITEKPCLYKHQIATDFIKANQNRDGLKIILKFLMTFGVFDMYKAIKDVVGNKGELFDQLCEETNKLDENTQRFLKWFYINKFDK